MCSILKIRGTVKLFSGISILTIAMACSHKPEVPVNVYYFNFSGQEQNSELKTVYDRLIDEFNKYNYCITPDQRLICLPRDTVISPALLDKLHPALHQVDLYDSAKNYKTGSVRVDVQLMAYGPGDGIQTRYTWFKKTDDGKWKLTEDFGVLTLHHLTSGNSDERKHFLGTEFARETYR